MHWILKRNDTNEQIRLHPQFRWMDELDWTPLAQSEPVYTLTGSMDIQQGTKKAGRPITLNGDNTRTARADIETLKAWSSVPELILTLTHPKGAHYGVIFSRPALDNVQAIKPYRPIDEADSDKYTLNLHFITV